jgi:20S proteasome subunit alpha 7
VTSIVGGWDSEAELAVDGQVGSGPKSGAGGKIEGAKAGGPALYMIEPSGLYWVSTAKAPISAYQSLYWGMLTGTHTGILRCCHR